MPDYTTETLIYIGEPATAMVNGYAGWRTGCEYQVRSRHRADGLVAIALDHEHYTGAGEEMVLTMAEFEKWFRN